MRTILHSDCNNFYASVESVYDPALRGKPLAICGDPDMRHGIVLAKNEQAKKCGIQTGETVWQAKQKCAGLTVVVPDQKKYLLFSRKMRNIYRSLTDRVEPFGLDESWLDVSGSGMSGEKAAAYIRSRAREEMGITLSVGVSFNKVFAKLASDLHKPDATTVISCDNFRQKLWPLPVGTLLFVGKATREKLSEQGIYTIGDLAVSPPNVVHALLGKGGDMLHSYARGEDESPVLRAEDEEALQSVGNSTTPPFDINDDESAKVVLCMLCESVATRLRAHHFKCRTVTLYVRDSALASFERQLPLAEPSDLAMDLYGAAMVLLHQCYGSWPRPIRTLGVRGTKLVNADEILQASILSNEAQKRSSLEKTVDLLRGRFGYACVQRGVMLHDKRVGRADPKEVHAMQPLSLMHGHEAG